jgi:hypothetical protein
LGVGGMVKTLREHIIEHGLKPKWWNVKDDILELPIPLVGLILTGGGDIELEEFKKFLNLQGIKAGMDDKLTFKISPRNHVSIHRIDGSHKARDCFILYSTGYIYSADAGEYKKDYGRDNSGD